MFLRIGLSVSIQLKTLWLFNSPSPPPRLQSRPQTPYNPEVRPSPVQNPSPNNSKNSRQKEPPLDKTKRRQLFKPKTIFNLQRIERLIYQLWIMLSING